MSAGPMDAMYAAVKWEPTGAVQGVDGLPYATHTGAIEIQLSNGMRVFDTDDVSRLLGGAIIEMETKS